MDPDLACGKLCKKLHVINIIIVVLNTITFGMSLTNSDTCIQIMSVWFATEQLQFIIIFIIIIILRLLLSLVSVVIASLHVSSSRRLIIYEFTKKTVKNVCFIVIVNIR